VKNDEAKERRRSKSVKCESDKIPGAREQMEHLVKSPSCTVTSAEDNKVYPFYVVHWYIRTVIFKAWVADCKQF
jgi:hypothetical protein